MSTTEKATGKANIARNVAYKRLAEAHPDEWRQILAEERESRGLPPEPTRGRTPMKKQLEEKDVEIQRLREELERQGVKYEDMRP